MSRSYARQGESSTSGLLSPIVTSGPFGASNSPTLPYASPSSRRPTGRHVHIGMPASPSPTLSPGPDQFFTPLSSPAYSSPMPFSPEQQEQRFNAFMARLNKSGAASKIAAQASPTPSRRQRSNTVNSSNSPRRHGLVVIEQHPMPPVPTVSLPTASIRAPLPSPAPSSSSSSGSTAAPPRPPRSKRRNSVAAQLAEDTLVLPPVASPVVLADEPPTLQPSPSRMPITSPAGMATSLQRRRETSVMNLAAIPDWPPPRLVDASLKRSVASSSSSSSSKPDSETNSPHTPITPAWPASEASAIATPSKPPVTPEAYARDRRLSSLFNGLGLALGETEPVNKTGESSDEGTQESSDAFESADEGVEDLWAAKVRRIELDAPASPAETVTDRDGTRDSSGDISFGFAVEDDEPAPDTSATRPRSVAELVRQSWRSSQLYQVVPQRVEEPARPSTPKTPTGASATADLIDAYACSPASTRRMSVGFSTPPSFRRRSRTESMAASSRAVQDWLPAVVTPSASRSRRNSVSADFESPVPQRKRDQQRRSMIRAPSPPPAATPVKPRRRSVSFAEHPTVFKPPARPQQTPESSRRAKRRSQARERSSSDEEDRPTPTSSRALRRRSVTASVLLDKPIVPASLHRVSLLSIPRPDRRHLGDRLDAPLPNVTLQTSMPEVMWDALYGRYGKMEMKRQALLFELTETEGAYVESLRGIIRIFCRPLLSGHAWIKGVPKVVGHLFDWLDDIMQLHTKIADALYGARDDQQPIIWRVADIFHRFIPQLEAYQPFLVRFEDATRVINSLASDPDSHFGEFIRLQQSLPECGAMPLVSFLLKPVQRLLKYPMFFKDLALNTPSSHPDHHAAVSLWQATDSIIRVMQEVKAREEEYQHIKLLATRIRGLPSDFVLEDRDARRLIAHGELRRVHYADTSPSVNEATGRLVPESSSMRSRQSSFNGRPLSIESEASLAPSDASSANSQIKHSLSAMMGLSSAGMSSHPSTSHIASFLRQRTVSGKLSKVSRPRETLVHVFVFTDLVILATLRSDILKSVLKSTTQTPREDTYRLLDGCGLSRVISVADVTGRTEHGQLLEVDVLPMTTDERSRPTTTLYLSVNTNRTSSPESLIREREKWLDAFEQSCHQSMLLLDPSSSHDRPGMDRSSSASIVAAGLPIPKSPSKRDMLAAMAGPDPHYDVNDPQRTEQAERSFWMQRFRTVRRQMVAQSPQ